MSGDADIDFHLHPIHWERVLFAPSLRLLDDAALDDTAALDSGRGDYGHLADGTVDAYSIFDRKLLRNGWWGAARLIETPG